jgi:electron transport complex protein RnfG
MLRLYMRLGVPVVAVCIVAAAGLAGTYALTAERIAVQDREAKARALKAALPTAVGFVELDRTKDAEAYENATAAAGDTRVDGLFRALDGSGAQVGWGVMVAPRGYGGPMPMAVGVDRNGKVSGVTIIAQNETPGLGTKAVGSIGGPPSPYLAKFMGVDAAAGAEGVRKLETIQGATKSSRGVKNGVGAASAVFADVLSKMEGGSGQ